MDTFISMSANVTDVVKSANNAKYAAIVLLIFGGIGAVMLLFFILKQIMSYRRSEVNYIMSIVGTAVILIIGIGGWYVMKNKAAEQYLILVHDYNYTCWYEGTEVDIDTMDINKYTVEIDDANKMLKLTKPVYYHGTGYIPHGYSR